MEGRRDNPSNSDLASAQTKRPSEIDLRDEKSDPEQPDLMLEETRGASAQRDEKRPRLDALLPDEEGAVFRERWRNLQARFVDEPQRSVEEADALVAGLMRRLAEGFAEERERLEAHWTRGDQVSTEDLRVALQHYRSFFERLLEA